MGNRKTKKRSSHRMECENKPKKKSLDVSEKYSESLIALNESSFKIRRFMNDVTSFKENPNHRTKRTIRHESEVKDKENVNLKSSLATKKSKNHDGSRTKRDGDSKNKFTFQGKKGLFENGVATKTRTFCRGLMPPIWNARLNADLRSILNLSCVDAPRRHAPSTSVAEPIDDCFESTRSRSPDASVINSRLAKDVEKKTSSPKRSKNHQLESIFNDDDNDESLVHASCSQVGGAIASEPAADSEAADVSGIKSDLVSAVNLNDHYLRFTHCIVKSLSSTRFDREELESTSKKPVRFLAEFYRERLAQAQDEQNEEVESPALLPRDVSQNKENSQRSQPTLSQPTDYGAKSIRSDEWPTISRMKAQADEKFLKDSVISKGKIYTSGLKLLEAVYGQNNENNHQKTYNHLSVTPPKCTFSPIAEDIVSNSSFVNPVSGKKDWLPDFKSFSPPKAQLCTCCRRNNDCNFMNCTDESCRNNVLNYDLMTSGGGDRNEFKSCDFTCGMNSRGCWDGKSCFTNYKTVIKSERNLEKTLDSGRSRTADSTADCLTILPPKSHRLERWRASGLQTELRNKFEDSAVDTKDLLTLPLRLPALDSPDIQYYPRKMF